MNELTKCGNSEISALMAIIERVAVNENVDIEKMMALLDMQERVMDRNSKSAFSAAMAAMQADIPEVVERGKAHNNTRYATFEDINAALRPILQKYGFAVTFRIKQNDTSIKITAVLSHREGHSEETEIILPADTSGSKNNVQAVGSTVSYGKRYAMSALLNIATRGEDDDAAGAVKVKMVSAFQAQTITKLYSEATEEVQEWLRNTYGSAQNVPAADYNKIVEDLRKGKDNADI